MTVKIKKLHPNAVIPTYAKQGDAGIDLTAVSVKHEVEFGCFTYDTGVAVEIPEGYVGLVFPRSSLSKKDLILTNHVGVIDSGYRGSILLKFKLDCECWSVKESQEEFNEGIAPFYFSAEDEYRKFALDANIYAVGDRIAQLIVLPYPQITFEEVEELSTTERNDGGFGSTNVR